MIDLQKYCEQPRPSQREQELAEITEGVNKWFQQLYSNPKVATHYLSSCVELYFKDDIDSGYRMLRNLSKLFPKNEEWIIKIEQYLKENNLLEEYLLFSRIKGKELPPRWQRNKKYLT